MKRVPAMKMNAECISVKEETGYLSILKNLVGVVKNNPLLVLQYLLLAQNAPTPVASASKAVNLATAKPFPRAAGVTALPLKPAVILPESLNKVVPV